MLINPCITSILPSFLGVCSYELLSDSQEIVLFVGRLLNYIEEGVLHYYLGCGQELLVRKHCPEVSVVKGALGRRDVGDVRSHLSKIITTWSMLTGGSSIIRSTMPGGSSWIFSNEDNSIVFVRVLCTIFEKMLSKMVFSGENEGSISLFTDVMAVDFLMRRNKVYFSKFEGFESWTSLPFQKMLHSISPS